MTALDFFLLCPPLIFLTSLSFLLSSFLASLFAVSVQATVALGMSRRAWSDVELYERMHAWKCGDIRPKLRMVQAVTEVGQEKRNIHALKTQAGETKTNTQTDKIDAIAPPITPIESKTNIQSRRMRIARMEEETTWTTELHQISWLDAPLILSPSS